MSPSTLEHKGFKGSAECSPEDRIFHGRILGIRDLVIYSGKTFDDLEEDFQTAVEDYVAACKEFGKEPDKSFSGNISLRTDPQLHRDMMIRAESEGLSLNRWIVAVLNGAVERPYRKTG